MRRIVLVVVSLCVLARPVPMVFAEDGSQRVIQYDKDALTVKLDKVPLTDVLAEVAKQSGAEVQGDILHPRDLTLQLDKVPLKEALERLLGEQNFALTYAEDGKLKTIHLKGGREAAPAKTAKSKDVQYTALPGGEGETPPLWKAVYEAFEDRGTVPVDGRLSKVVGTEAAPWDLLANTAIGHPDPVARREAVEAGMKAYDENPDLQKAVQAATKDASDADLAEFARAATYGRAEELIRNIRNTAQTPELRERAEAILREHAKIPYKGPKMREGQRTKPSEG
jgi:hypothetical protein